MSDDIQKAIEKRDRMLEEKVCEITKLRALSRDMLCSLVIAVSGNGDPRELNKSIEEYADRMEALGAI